MKHSNLYFPILLLLIVIYPSPLSSISQPNFYDQSMKELIFYTASISVTPDNLSFFLSMKVTLGLIYAGGQSYQLDASLFNGSSISLGLFFERDNQSILITLDSNNILTSSWDGFLSFDSCCNNTLSPLTLHYKIINQISNTNTSSEMFKLYYSIFKFPITNYQGFVPSGEINAVGYPYPKRFFIIGLMIILLGQVPVLLVIALLMRLTRKQKS